MGQAARPWRVFTAILAQGAQMFAMHMDKPLCPRAFVQIIDILRHNQQFARPLRVQFGQGIMGGVRLGILNRRAAFVIKFQHQIRVAGKGFGCGDILYAVLCP